MKGSLLPLTGALALFITLTAGASLDLELHTRGSSSSSSNSGNNGPRLCTPGGVNRPLLHYSPLQGWMNDPNGLVVGTDYFTGAYHMHYQYNPNGTTWGPMHWGHAVSFDLVHWKEQPIALYPDDLGTIFSGSAQRDVHNTTGFATKDGTGAIILIYTQDGLTQQQSIAYTNDNGLSYTKFDKNPVLPNPGLPNFRDPKVIRFNDYKWIMLVAAGDRILFYSSWNMKQWEKLSEFGAQVGSHDGVWECPDLFVFEYEGWEKWVLLVSINPGGPNGGSGTQYFIGDFDGVAFILDEAASSNDDDDNAPRWLDWGPDNYASVSYEYNVSPWPKVYTQGWASNWDYAEAVPTEGWRGSMTLPRELELIKRNGRPTLIQSFPLEVEKLYLKGELTEFQLPMTIAPGTTLHLTDFIGFSNELFQLTIAFNTLRMSENSTVNTCFFNGYAEQLCLVYEKRTNRVILDRSRSGKIDFSDKFSLRPYSERASRDEVVMFDIIMDTSMIEVLIDHGASSMTGVFFPIDTFREIRIDHEAPDGEGILTFFGGSIRGCNSIYC